MATDNPESSTTPSSQTEAGPPHDAAEGRGAEGNEARSDAPGLVERMVAAGEWPEPALLKQIIESGDAAVEPLLAILRSRPRGWPAEAPLDHAIGILGEIRPPAAIPELVEIIKQYRGDAGEAAAISLSRYGAEAFQPLLELCRDPSVTGYPRTHSITAARGAAGKDPILKSRLAEVIRPYLAELIDRARQTIASQPIEIDTEDEDDLEEVSDEDARTEEDPDDAEIGDESQAEPVEGHSQTAVVEEDQEPELDLEGAILFLVLDLAGLADPLARDLIKTAFDEDLVDTFWLRQRDVDELFRKGGEAPRKSEDWLGGYQEQYRAHFDKAAYRPQLSPMRQREAEQRDAGPRPSQFVPSLEPLRHTGPRPGRNDPCWCGSGKKYKKCHLGKDS